MAAAEFLTMASADRAATAPAGTVPPPFLFVFLGRFGLSRQENWKFSRGGTTDMGAAFCMSGTER
jgi:hypothetical protein